MADVQWQWVNGQPVAAVALDAYETANLLAALEAIMEHGHGNPLGILNSGDWVGQIRWKLPTPEALGAWDVSRFGAQLQPNRTPESYAAEARRWTPPQTRRERHEGDPGTHEGS